MIGLFKYLEGCHTEKGQDWFLIIPECRTHNNGLKLKEARFWLKNLLTVRAVWQWNQLPQELVGAPTLEAFKKSLDNLLADMLWLYSCIEQGGGLDGLVGPFQLHFSMIMWAVDEDIKYILVLYLYQFVGLYFIPVTGESVFFFFIPLYYEIPIPC